MTGWSAPAAVRTLSLITLMAGAFAGPSGHALGAPGDIVFERKGGETAGAAYPPAYFRHWTHMIRYRCLACHPALFEMEQGADQMTMDEMRQGRFCGACHTGRAAFDIGFQNCSRCHTAPGQAPPAAPGEEPSAAPAEEPSAAPTEEPPAAVEEPAQEE